MRNKIFVVSFFVVLIFILVSLITNILLYHQHSHQVNEVVLRIIANVKENHPDIEMVEIINILNNEGINPINLEAYGISANDFDMLRSTRSNYNLLIIGNMGLILLLGLSFSLIFYLYKINQKAKIKELTGYIREIARKNYALKLEDNQDDELSILQNELYKITILLKEQSEHALKDKQNVKDGVSDISHQLKTPLTSILIGLDNLIDNKNLDDVTRAEFLNDIKEQTLNINFLITSILKLSRFDANVIEFKKEPIKVKQILTEITKNLSSLIKLKKIKLNINGDDNITFKGDYKWELEALTNIIKNSIEHLDVGGELKISYCKLSVYTEIIIEDNGKGIDTKDLKHIFKRFYKGKNSKADSIGIGLSLAKKIIEHDNGFIKVKSKLGEGTKFIIRYLK